ncbi:TPA: hypothetical protein CPT82_03075 [Candidatus Gastranaerophilales bacterium HUM_2]|nr:MAG TPA: hypothetical protein CPT82_03075 [Candidatus Gastranaerophilales bacterium HUM_2]
MKIKQLTKEQLTISIDRLTRFKETETKYLRVFKDIITNNLIEPKIKKHELDEMDYENLKNIAENIINSSVLNEPNDLQINQNLYEYENSVFNLNENCQKLVKNKINYKAIIKILPENIPNNLKWLKNYYADKNSKNNLGYPVHKIILCEGITEEILLPVFSKLCNFDFNEHGIQVISAGGKNQVVKYFYNFAECLKIPIFVLLDNDAKINLEEIKPRLRNIDKIHLLKSGEFEDMLPNSLIARTLNYATQNISLATIEGLEESTSKVEFLEEFFKHRGLHEFKKAEFATLVKANVKDKNDISVEIKEIISEIKGTYSPLKNGV